jgi:hypothetical protein
MSNGLSFPYTNGASASQNPTVPDVELPGGGLEGPQPDALTPYPRAYEREALSRKFDVPASESLLDTLDDPSRLIAAMLERGQELSVAEVLLSEILAQMRRRVHHGYGSNIVVPIVQSAAGYTKIMKPPSANQYIKLVTFCVAPVTSTGFWQLLQGDSETSSDKVLTGRIADNAGSGPVFWHAPNPDENPILQTSYGLTLGLLTSTNAHEGLAVVRISDGPV